MIRQKMWVEYEGGSYLSQSQKKPGDYSPLTREYGTNRLGQVTLSPIGEDEADSLVDWLPIFVTDEYASDSRAEESSEPGDLLRSLLIIGAILALRAVEPHVKRWWSSQALPTMKSMRNRLARTREADSQVASAESSTLMESAPADASHEVVAPLEV